MNESLQAVVDQHQRRELTDGELEVLQHPLTYEDIFPADIAEALTLLMEPYPCDPYCAALIFMAAMSGVMPLGTAVNHRTKIFPANMFVAPVSATGTTKTSQLEELVEFPLRLVRAKVANHNAQELEDYLALPRSKRPSKPPTPLLCDTGDATPEALVVHLVRQCKEKKALLFFKDEISEFFQGMVLDMKSGRGSSQGLFLECFDGKGRTKTTRGDGVLSYPASKLSFVGCIQPQVLSELMQGTDYAGKWARLLCPAMPTRLLQLVDADLTNDEDRAFKDARTLLENLAVDLYEMEPSICDLTAEARDTSTHGVAPTNAEPLIRQRRKFCSRCSTRQWHMRCGLPSPCTRSTPWEFRQRCRLNGWRSAPVWWMPPLPTPSGCTVATLVPENSCSTSRPPRSRPSAT